MIFGIKSKEASDNALTDRNYGIYDNKLVFVYSKPLSDKQIAWIIRQCETSERLQSQLIDNQQVRQEIDKQVIKELDNMLQEYLSN